MFVGKKRALVWRKKWICVAQNCLERICGEAHLLWPNDHDYLLPTNGHALTQRNADKTPCRKQMAIWLCVCVCVAYACRVWSHNQNNDNEQKELPHMLADGQFFYCRRGNMSATTRNRIQQSNILASNDFLRVCLYAVAYSLRKSNQINFHHISSRLICSTRFW